MDSARGHRRASSRSARSSWRSSSRCSPPATHPPRGCCRHQQVGPREPLCAATTEKLSLLLAGSQLGITACTLALGEAHEPAVHSLAHSPLIHATGAPMWIAQCGRLRVGARRRHLPAPGDRRNGAEVMGDRPSRAGGDHPGDTHAHVHGGDAAGAHSAEPRCQLVRAHGRRRPRRRTRYRAGSGYLAATGGTLRRPPGHSTSGTTATSPLRWSSRG